MTVLSKGVLAGNRTRWAVMVWNVMVVILGSSKTIFLGDASIDFADFATAIEPIVTLPLKFANPSAILHDSPLQVELREACFLAGQPGDFSVFQLLPVLRLFV
ncbi:hypothetical protein Dsin_010298 [Dipteronia sinensis]|uniref:Uncharacterized protein n=1 Tax=Dipteronia sinensis TaxID=43782 RepID=A0AAE0AS85_9ROSI|nr:hypothetical protein Dsin_010298 [Dipteronia sinensis]